MHKSDVHRGGSSSVSGRGRGGSRGGFSNSSNAASVGGSHANSGPQSVNGHSTDSGNSRGGRGKGSWSNGPPPGARGSFGDSKPSGYGQPVQQSEQLERIYSLFMYMVGTKVIAVVKDNAKYEGILRTAVASPDIGVILDMARLVVEGKPKGPVIQCLAILPKDLLSLSAYGLEVTDPTTNSDVGSKGGFETDAAIGSRVGNFGRERELVQWASDVPDETNTSGLDDYNANAKWDQFATNERLFGVETDFQEDIYTTVIDRNDPNFKRKEAEAQRIAKEIEAGFGKTDNIHLLEEQNLKAGNDGAEDEESKYSSVMRKPDRPDNAYVPPGARRAGAPAEPGKVKPDIAISISSAVTAPNRPDYAALNTAPASTKPIAIPDPQQAAQQGESLASTVARTQSRSGRVSPAPGVEVKKSSPTLGFESGKAGAHPGRGAKERKEELLNRLPLKGQKEGLTFSTRPDFVGEIRGGFQKFAEGQRAQIKKPLREALTKPRPDMFSELKAFSTNFKVPMPFPADLKEIIRKSPESESQKLPSESVSASTSPKSAKKAESLSRPASFSNERSVSEVAPPSSKSITAAAKAKLAKDVEEKVDVKDAQSSVAASGEKSKFKFNLGAAEFTPSFGAGSSSPSAQGQGIPQDRQRPASVAGMPKGPARNNSGGSYTKGYQKNFYGQQFRPQYPGGYDEGVYPPQMDPNQPYYYSMQPGPYPVPYRPMMPARPGFMPGGMPPPQTIIGPNGVPYMVPYGVPPGAMVPPMMGMGMPMYRPGGPLAPAGGKNGPPSPNAAPAQLQGQPPAGQQNSPQSAGQPPQMMSGYRPPPPGAVPEGYASPQSRPPYIVAPGVPGPPHEGMYQPGMMAYPPQGYYPGHPGMMMPIVWTGDPMQMAEMQQQMMQQGPHQMPLGMMPADLQESEGGDEDLDGEPEVDQLELEGQDEVEGVEPASPEVAES